LPNDILEDLKIRAIQALDILNRVNPFIELWVKRYSGIFTDEQLLLSEFGINIHFDFSIPLVWDWERDIYVVVGDVSEPYIEALRTRGQRRFVQISDAIHHSHVKDGFGFFHSLDEVASYIQGFGALPPNKAKFYYSNGSSVDNDIQLAIETRFDDLVRGLWSNHNTIKLFSRNWIHQGIQNLRSIASSHNWDTLKYRKAYCSAIIVSPGPSLDKNIELLEKAKDTSYIICTAQALRMLVSKNIYPHLVTVIDPQDMSHYFEGIDLRQIQDGLLLGVTCHPRLWSLDFNHFFTFDASRLSDDWILNLFNDQALGFSGGSVSISSLIFAVNCGFDKVALVGQDLALTDNKQYARNASDGEIVAHFEFDESRVNLSGFSPATRGMTESRMNNPKVGSSSNSNSYSTQLLKLSDFYGGEVFTTSSYYEFHQQFQRIPLHFSSFNVEFYNCTEGGAYIPNFNLIPLIDYIGGCSPIEPKAQFNIHADDLHRHSNLTSHLIRVISKLESLDLICMSLIDLINDLFCNSSTTQIPLELKALEAQVFETLGSLPFLQIGIKNDLDIVLVNTQRSLKMKDVLVSELHLFELIHEEIQYLLPLFKSQYSKPLVN
jgi:hypothetical protein